VSNSILTPYFEVFGDGTMKLRQDLKFRVQKLNPKAIAPIRAHSTDAGVDFFSTVKEIIPPGGRRIISTGLRVAIPECWSLILKDKSGLAKNNGIHILAGVIDCFSEDTVISTVAGNKTIKEISIEEPCFSFNEENSIIEKDYISAIMDTGEQEVIVFETEQGCLKVTPGTKVYTRNGIKLASEITEEDELIFEQF